MDWNDYSFIVKGGTRTRIFLALEKPKPPSQIGREIGLSTTHVSRALKEFSGKGLVECLTPAQRSGKLYILTERGREVHTELKNNITKPINL